jgi:glucosamine--fructose-6-phosphate aminotransferase (isomerizing)
MLIACGTSFYAATVGKYLGESLLGSSFRAELASELNYMDALPPADIGIALTQSGETLDTLNAMKRLRSSGIPVLAITNVVGSTASKIADQTLYTRAGPEISVAASKTFTAQLVALYWMIVTDPRIDPAKRSHFIRTLRQMPEKLQRILAAKDSIVEAAEWLAASENVFYIGRGVSYPVAMEGALKLKEVAYIHSEAYAAGEIKHGPFALLSARTPVVAVVALDNTREPMLTSIKEIKARSAPVLAIAQEEDEMIEDLADKVLRVPSLEPLFSPFVNTVVVQLLAYYAARKRGCPIDFPRNLAKSVTVE